MTVRKGQIRTHSNLSRVKMSDVMVNSVSPSDSGAGSITENVALSFSKVELDYVRQKPDGTPGETSYFKWDFSANKPF